MTDPVAFAGGIAMLLGLAFGLAAVFVGLGLIPGLVATAVVLLAIGSTIG
jgi:hypothetical protein